MEEKNFGSGLMELFKKEKEYWLNKFDDGFQVSTIVYDLSPDTKSSKVYKTENFRISDKLFEKLIWLINGSDYRLLMVLIANYFLLLRKYSNNKDLTVGTTIYNQESNVDFINTILPLKTNLNGNLSFKDLIINVRNCLNEAIEHQNFPMATLIHELKLDTNNNFNPLFDSLILLRNIQNPSYIKGTKPNIILEFNKKEDSIEVSIEYNSALYEDSTIDRIKKQYITLLSDALSNLDKKISDIKLISDEEEDIILHKFNSDQKIKCNFKTIPNWFDSIAQEKPNNIAVQFYNLGNNSSEKLTYKDLSAKVKTLSDRLLRLGVKKGDIITLLLEQSIDRVISMLAVLECGAVYLPIELNTPSERLKFIIKDTNTNTLISKSKNLNAKEFLNELFTPDKILLLDNPVSIDKELEIENTVISEDDPAYIIYTSGSTGKPKGVLINHRGLINYTNWRHKVYELNENDVTLQLLSYSFDGYVSNFFSSIVSGGRLVFFEDTETVDPNQIAGIVKESGVTNMSLIPKLFETVINASNKNDLKSLRFVVLAGEKTENGFLSQLEKEFNTIKIVNEFGPTEASVTSTAKQNFSTASINCIGTPIYNTKVLIINSDSNLNPIKLPGEICIIGDGLARGYLNDPEKTADTFMPNQFFNNSLMYKTGDIGYWNENGEIIYEGRRDNQFKIRGFRIELREIESCLKDHPKISQVVVLPRKINNSHQLVAYYETTDKKEIENLSAFLGKYLPKYMIPDYFMHLIEVPKTVSGKLDQKALALPEDKIAFFKKPENETEKVLTQIWAEVLDRDKETISTNSNFFEIGGHSLNATFISTKVQKYLSVKISMIEVFENPTIEALSKIIADKTPEKYVPVQNAILKDSCELTPAQKRFFFLQQYDKNSTAYNIPIALEIKGDLDANTIKRIFKQLIERHQCLRTIFEIEKGVPVQKLINTSELIVEIFRIEESELQNVRKNFVRPFNLNEYPLFRIGLIEINGRFKYFLFDIHHIIIDALSMQMIVNEFIQIYAGNLLSEIEITYLDYIQNRLAEVKSDEYKKQEKFWVDCFGAGIPRLNLPIDFERKAATPVSNFYRFTINSDYKQKLIKIAKDNEVSLYMLILSVFKIFISKITGQKDIVVGTPVSGRNHPDVNNLIGLFINTVVLRNVINKEDSFENFLKAVRQNTLMAFDNQSYDFSDLVDKVEKERIDGRNPIFDVFFVFDNFKIQKTINRNLELSPLDYVSTTAKFDFTLMVLSENTDLEFIIEYNEDLFKKETIIKLSSLFKDILKEISDCTGKKISEYNFNKRNSKEKGTTTDFQFKL